MRVMAVPFWTFIFFINVISILALKTPEDDSLIVNTSLGSLRGVLKESFSGKTIKVFYKVPFAEPPVGKLRFQPPEPIKEWNGTLDNTNFGPACMQNFPLLIRVIPVLNTYFGLGNDPPSEDCLFLNVFVPTELKEKTPVMVWFYGGGFMIGTANSLIYDGTTLAAEENVIVVTFNYRVSTLGFLYLGIDGAAGNMGLMDQAMALKWIQSHISSFGGDPDRVTVFGESAGAFSINHHLYINSSQGLFQRAILQSGVAHSFSGYESRKNMLKSAEEYASYLGCTFNSSNPAITLECLMEKDAIDLIENEIATGYGYNLYFKPVVDGKYITEHPLLAIEKTAKLINVSIITGNVEDESSLFLLGLFPFKFLYKDDFEFTEKDSRETIQKVLGLTNSSVIMDLTIGIYSDFTIHDLSKRHLKLNIKFFDDLLFKCGSLQLENAMLEANNTVYKYRYRLLDEKIPAPKWMGIVHSTDVGAVFGVYLDQKRNVSQEYKSASRKIMQYWANFARTGNPNISPIDNDDLAEWPAMTKDYKTFLVLDSNLTQTGYENEYRCNFITEALNKIYDLEKQVLPLENRLIIKTSANKFLT